MKSSFKNHKAEFEKLVQMVNEDKDLSFVSQETADMEKKTPMIPQERLNEYRTLMNQVGVLNLYAERASDSSVRSISFRSSNADLGFLFTYKSAKDFIWFANNQTYYKEAWLDFVILPIPDLTATDGYDYSIKELVNPIENHWYLKLWVRSCDQCSHGD